MDQTSAEQRALGWKLFALSFAALFLELMFIRWVPSIVRLVAYYANLMLISSFLGLGIGAMVSMRGWRLSRWFVPLVATQVGFVLACRYVALPGSAYEVRFFETHRELIGYAVLVAVFVINTLVFVPLGAQIGAMFHKLPTLRAYAWDLGGSLCGTLAFGVFSFLHFTPALGVGVALAVAIALDGKTGRALRVLLAVATLGGVALSSAPGAIWSPYYYVTVEMGGQPAGAPPADLRTMRDPPAYLVRVNQDFYQQHFTLDPRRYSDAKIEAGRRALVQYTLPEVVRPGAKRVLVLGAGGGVDVEAALLHGAEHVDAVEIDPSLVALSRHYNASAVYDDPRVHIHIDDGRAFMERCKGDYDLIVFGLLDSQALFSYGNNVRLDGYIYTVQSLRNAYSLLAPGGMVSLAFSAPRPWLGFKLSRMMREATGVEPIVATAGTAVILMAFNGPPPAQITLPEPFALTPVEPGHIALATDDWPFLYLFRKAIPGNYLVVIATLLALSTTAVLLLRGRRVGCEDGHFFFLGLGFLLLQTKSIGDCSLYFGVTWVVTTIVIVGVLLMVIAANFVAIRLPWFSSWFYVPLLASLILLAMTPPASILGLSYGARLAWALLVVPLPIFFAGLIFSTTFRDAPVPSAVFGANLIGATIGGFSEYLAMALGTHALWWIVIAAYAGSFICRACQGRSGVLVSSVPTLST
jgi:hypothetical protein